jgi:hypothetical protein
VLLEAATSTTRETWATCTCPECGKGFRQEISVPDRGARIKAVETLLREGLGRVGEADVIEPKMPTSVDEVKNLSWDELNLVFAVSHATEIGTPPSLTAGTDGIRHQRTGPFISVRVLSGRSVHERAIRTTILLRREVDAQRHRRTSHGPAVPDTCTVRLLPAAQIGADAEMRSRPSEFARTRARRSRGRRRRPPPRRRRPRRPRSRRPRHPRHLAQRLLSADGVVGPETASALNSVLVGG